MGLCAEIEITKYKIKVITTIFKFDKCSFIKDYLWKHI
jgi:hypothetical protein